MAENRRCSQRGGALVRQRPCPACLLQLGLRGGDLALSGPGAGVTVPANSSVLDTIAATIGADPRVLLRDTAPGEVPSPLINLSGAPTDPTLRYRIDGEIARGGMGAVLKGRDPDLGRDGRVFDVGHSHPTLRRRGGGD